MNNLKIIQITVLLLIPFFGISQFFAPPSDTTYKRTIAIKQDLTRVFYHTPSWQTSVDVRLLSFLSFETEFNFYYRFKYEKEVYPNVGALKSAVFLKQTNYFVSGILKLHTYNNRFYLGFKAATGRVGVQYQRVVCLETLLSPGGLCECVEWENEILKREMKQFMIGGRMGYKVTLSEVVVLDFYVDVIQILYDYPKGNPSIFDASCPGVTNISNPLRVLPGKPGSVDNIFLAKSGDPSTVFQIGIKIGYVF